jgi:hypothetical protein
VTEEETYLYQLQGRILAAEKLLVALLLNYAASARPSHPVSAIDALEKGIKQGLQHAEFEPGPEADVIWESMAEALHVTLNTAREKIRGFEKRQR